MSKQTFVSLILALLGMICSASSHGWDLLAKLEIGNSGSTVFAETLTRSNNLDRFLIDGYTNSVTLKKNGVTVASVTAGCNRYGSTADCIVFFVETSPVDCAEYCSEHSTIVDFVAGIDPTANETPDCIMYHVETGGGGVPPEL